MTPICLCLEGASLKARHTFITPMRPWWPTHHNKPRFRVQGPKGASGSVHFEAKRMFFTGDAGHAGCDLSGSRKEEPDLWVQAEQHQFGIASPLMGFLHLSQYLTLCAVKKRFLF